MPGDQYTDTDNHRAQGQGILGEIHFSPVMLIWWTRIWWNPRYWVASVGTVASRAKIVGEFL